MAAGVMAAGSALALSGGVVLAVAVTIAGATALGTVLLWPRLAARRPLHVVGRVGLLVGGNLAVLLAVGVAMNDSFQFFSDWRDLSGAFSGARPRVASAFGGGPGGAAGSSPAVHDGRSPSRAATTTGVRTAVDGRLVTYRVTGGASGITADVYVLLPPGGDALRRAGPRLPVLETFAGYPADPRQWLGAMGLQRTLDQSSAAGVGSEPLVVLPTVEVPAGVDTECADTGSRGSDVETWLADDVPTWLSATFPVAATRQGWATMGLSTGGFCAVMLAMHHPDAYAAGISFGGYYRAAFPASAQPARTDPRLVAYDLIAQARRAPPPVALWLMTSATDALSYRSTEALLRAARAPLSVHADTLVDAGHRTAVFAPLVGTALRWLTATAPGFAATPAR